MMRLIFLIGYRGTGKTTLGQLLSERIGWDFVDADVHLEATCGKSIKQIFASDGEPAFRDMESRMLHELCGRERLVIGTGGGVVGREENRALLRAAGYVVWLRADLDTIAARLAADPSTPERRPNLSSGGLAEIAELLRVREPLYRASADLEVDTRARSPQELVETILNAWHSSGSRSSG
jgi:shikimate kinase